MPSGTQPIASSFETPRVLGATALEEIPYITNPNALEFILSELSPLLLSEQVRNHYIFLGLTCDLPREAI